MSELDDAVQVLRSGGLVAFPTETVYGIGANADDEAAIARLMAVKRRPLGQPITVHLGPSADLEAWGRLSRGARQLAARYLPGPLTIIVPRRARVLDAVTGGTETVGLRVPDHELCMALLDGFGGGVAASSANRKGQPPPQTAQGAFDRLGTDIDHLMVGEVPPTGLPSTVLSLVGQPRILREGGLGRDELQDVLGERIATP